MAADTLLESARRALPFLQQATLYDSGAKAVRDALAAAICAVDDATNSHETPAGSMRRRLPCVPFRDVPRAALFECNGNIWRKVSTRTAVMHWPAGPERAFYFSKRDMCHAERLPPA